MSKPQQLQHPHPAPAKAAHAAQPRLAFGPATTLNPNPADGFLAWLGTPMRTPPPPSDAALRMQLAELHRQQAAAAAQAQAQLAAFHARAAARPHSPACPRSAAPSPTKAHAAKRPGGPMSRKSSYAPE